MNQSEKKSPQATMFAKADELNHNCYIARWLETGKFAYESHKDIDAWLDKYKQVPNEKKMYGEIHREGKAVCEYYDIDEKQKGQDMEEWIDGFVKTRNEFCKTIDLPPIRKHHLLVLESCNDDKFSLHILVRNKRHFTTIADHKLFARQFQSWLEDNDGAFAIDTSVYNKNSVFRCVYSHKPNQTRIFKPTEANEDRDIKLTFCSTIEEGSIPHNVAEPEKKVREVVPHTHTGDELVELFWKLDKRRWDERESWRNLIWLGTSEGIGRDELCELSAQSDKHTDEAVDEIIDGYRQDACGITMGTLKFFLREDLGDDEYMKLFPKKQTSFMIDECVKDEQKMLWCDFNVKVPKRTCFTDVAFGDIFKLLYGDKFRFTNGFIYHFNGVYWERDNKQKSNINCFIDNVFYQDLKKWILGKILYWTKKAGETEDDDKNNKGIAFWTRVNLSVKDYIKTQRTKAEMIKAIESKVCNDSQEWDLNPYIFVFNNCVFDLKLGKKVEPNPQDFMTTCCGWDYDDNYNDVGIEKFIETIQQDKSVRDYLMKAYYSCMTGIQSRNVYIFTGSGGNGKSVLDELLMSMLGGYGYALPKAFLTQPFKDGANPEAIALHNKRCIIVSEPDAKKNICCSSLKALSGDSKISSRKLYGEIESVNIVATSIVECNTPPNLDEMNDAMSDRLGEGVIHFNSKFVKKSVYDAMSEDERVGISVGNDYYGEDAFKIESRQSLFNYLLGYRDKKVAVPNSVKQSSKVYLAKSDIFYDWFCDNYEVDNENVCKIKDIYYEFKNDNYDVLKTDKKTYGTEKNFTSALRSNIFIRKYFKERDAYYKGEQLKSNSLVGWKKKKEEDDIVCDDASTIVDE